MSLDSNQCKAARTLLGWSQADLEREAKVAKKTIVDFETGKRRSHPRTLAALRDTLEAAGVIFIKADAHGGPGVRLKG